MAGITIPADRERTTGAKQGLRKAMIVALARKLLIARWRYVTIGEVPAGAVLRPSHERTLMKAT
jgi:transposase